MGKHIQPQEHPLKAPPHSGSSKAAPPKRTLRDAAKSAPEPPSERSVEITDEQIATRAYEIWLERGRPDGLDREHWLEAERQLRQQIVAPQAATTPLLGT
jgi:hypothetical protein